MPNPYFSFKQFTVYHDRCAMKVGTDGVLLGAWADVVSARNILDIGTGTGLISLMMAQRCNARIRAVDIDADAVEQARGNVAASPWQDRIEVELQDICHFTSETLFDVIVSNPPYFTDSLKCPGKQRNIARHTDFLDFDKQNEKKMFRDSKKRNVIFVLSIILGAISLFLWNSRCTMDNFNKQETLTYLMVSVIMLIISIYGISTTCADMFLTVLLKNKKMKYQNDNLFVARTFASKARTMSFTFGTLSMLILISLLALNYSSINKASYDISVNLNAPYDVQLFDDKQVFDEYIRVIEEEYTIDNTIEYDIYKEPNHQVQNFFQSEYYDFDPVLKLSDYNRLLELRKMPLLSLNDNEYYIVTNSKFAYEVEDNKDIETITVANKNLKLKGYDTKSYWNSITNTGRFVVVLPDKYVQGLEVSENHLIIDTKEDTDAELENKIKEDMQHQLVKVDENGEINDESYRVNVRGAEIEQQKAMVAIVASLFMYIAFILISAVGTILAVQSLSDSTKYKYRYLTLRRLGINDKSLFKTIRKQLLILFCVPAISAILCSFVMMSSLNNVYQQILGDKHLYLMYFGLNLIIFFLIYSIYWIATYIGFKRNINEES